MARGPFQGAWQPNLRPTVVVAPDALVYINGQMEVIGCPSCGNTFDLNKYITGIQVDLSVDSSPGSASISLAVPRHSIDDFYFDNTPVITPMMEVEIFAKGFYLLNGIPQYYPIFWGLVTEVDDAYSSGAHTISINCADILKWWELCKVDTNPGLTQKPGQPLNFGNTFHGSNPFDMIFSLANQAMGDAIVPTGSFAANYKEQAQPTTFATALSDINQYWQQRFSAIRSNLIIYGMNGVAIRGDTLYAELSRLNKGSTPSSTFVSTQIRNANGGGDSGQAVYDPMGSNVTAFRTNVDQASVQLFQTEYQTKLELANTAKECIGYEFFMDVDGSIVFKPPFYNLDVLSNKPISWIQDIDIIDWNFSESEAEVVTQIIMQGGFAGSGNQSFGTTPETSALTTVTDYHLLRKYGWRTQTHNSEFLDNDDAIFYQGLDILDRLNARRHRGTVTIPMRTELRLGFPVYIAPKDQIWYVIGISHNISFGGRATTTLTLTAKREKFKGLRGTGTLTLTGMNAGKPPATGNNSALNAAMAASVAQGAQIGGGPATIAFPYTSRQLSAQGNFILNLGQSPAILPAFNSDVSSQTADGSNPYEVVILRNPTTGKIMGYPNVVMVYAGPYATSTPNLTNTDSNRGQASPGTSSAIQKNLLQKVTNTQTLNDNKRTLQQDGGNVDPLREKYLGDRYRYGLNSAGRFIYANDQGMASGGQGVIGELLLINTQGHMTVTPAPQDLGYKTFLSKQTIIRPISDERGFEVIGHYRYGRRVSLQDGSLVYTPTSATNSPVNVGTQLPLSGNLFDTLNAQSQGLTQISGAYSDPANAVATMTTSDLQTAAVPAVQPAVASTLSNTSASTGSATGTQSSFVSSAPLGTPQQTGAVQNAGLQATNLAKALTLAELEVQANSNDPANPSPSCPCLLQRSDLSFLNTGYTVGGIQITGTATAAPTSLGNLTPGASVTATYGSTSNPSPLQQSITTQTNTITALQQQLEAVQSRANAIDQTSNPIGWSAAQQTITQLQAQITQANAVLADMQEELLSFQGDSSLSTTGLTAAPSSGSTQQLAETFLTNLYKALDTPHQQLEHTLRGDYMPGGPLSQALPTPAQAASLVNTASNALASFASTAASANSNLNDIPAALATAANQITAASQSSSLANQLQQSQAQLTSVQSQIASVQAQISNQGSSVVTPGGQTLQQQLQALQKQAFQLQQTIASTSLQLQQFTNSVAGNNTSPF